MKPIDLLRRLGWGGCGLLLCAGAACAGANVNVNMSAEQAVDECMVAEICIDDYLWSLYARTPKIDTIKVPETKTITVSRKGRARTITTTVTEFVTEDFAWKDVLAAQKAGMSLKDYVIGGMDSRFKTVLYHALHALDGAGLEPGITSAFRDDFRQSIASGLKARDDNSYHGGSRHGGYGHGLAADVVSVRGATRAEQQAASEELWKWIDANGKEYGVGRPYLDRDAPHVGPVEGVEYVSHRGGPTLHQMVASAKDIRRVTPRVAPHSDHRLDHRLVAHRDRRDARRVSLAKSEWRSGKASGAPARSRPHHRIA